MRLEQPILQVAASQTGYLERNSIRRTVRQSLLQLLHDQLR